MVIKFIFILLLTLICLYSPQVTHSQFRSLDIAVTHPISEDAKPGDIVSLTGQNGRLAPASVAYDEKMFGRIRRL